jgi:hypothetical protein
MKKKQLHPLIGSSADASKVAMTWKGILVALVPAVTTVLAMAGKDVTNTDLTQLVEAAFVVVSAAITGYGLGRKIVLKLKK